MATVRRKSFSKGEAPCVDIWGQSGNLDDSQAKALQDFIAAVPPEDLNMAKFRVEAVESASLRFLRARNFDVHKAAQLLSECVQKKTELHASKFAALTPDECADCNVEVMKNWYPHSMMGYDKFNRPILFEKSGSVNPTAIHQMATKDGLIAYHWWTMENALNRMFEGAQSRVGEGVVVPIATCVVLDFTGLSMHHCSSKMMDHVKMLVNIDNCCYPELLGKMLVINAPWLAVTTWEIVRRWLDPRTQAKIEILAPGAESTSRLLEFINADQLPASYGGTCPHDYCTVLPHSDFITISRSSSMKHSIEVEPHKKVIIESYTNEGEMNIEIYSAVGAINSLNSSPKAQRKGSISGSHDSLVPNGGSVQLQCEHIKASGAPLRKIYTYTTGDEVKTFTVIWSNPAKLVSRSLTYCMTVCDIEDSSGVSKSASSTAVDTLSSCDTEGHSNSSPGSDK
jgi:hypothetical protein